MQIQMGVTQKIKLYNVYRLCKQNVDWLENYNFEKDNKAGIYIIHTWPLLNRKLNILKSIPSFTGHINDYIRTVPVLVRENVSPQINPVTAQKLKSKLEYICQKMRTIISLYESMNLKESGNGIDIKMPPCEYLDEYISYLQEINFVFTQCPFLQCEGEVLKFESVDVGSNWLKLTIATATTCMILNNTAALIDKALIIRSHYNSLKQQEEILRSQQTKNELATEITISC